ncbi:hypothetical protein AAC387_Pa09g2268 [Persea americana]
MMNARQRPFPFTASQWQELEHQALIFKYMVAGIPIPSDLLYPFRRGMDALSMSTPTPPRHFPTQPIGWGCFQMGCGRKPDPEPGRCRRTDGKKWRCSKEAFPDSKYCEKHMHRGRNRSRKPVEMTTATAANTSGDPSFANPRPNSAKPTTTPSLSSPLAAAENHHHSFLNPNPLSFRPPGIGFSTQNNSPHFTLGTGSISSSADRDYRYLHGLKEGVDEHPFFSEASGSLRNLTSAPSPFDSSWRSNTSSLAQLKHGNCSSFSSSYSQLQMHNDHTDMAKQQLEKHCFSLDHVNMKRADEPQQPLRQFFDEWPLKNRDSWLDLEEDPSNPTSFPATQLSISIPMASSEFPSSSPRPGNGD